MNTPTSPSKSALLMPVTKRPHGRSLADFGELLPAEQKLLACSETGEEAKIGETVPADDSDPNKIIRAGFLRLLLLGGDEGAPVREKGVQLTGAWIEGELDLENCFLPHSVKLVTCHFNELIIAMHAHFVGLLNLSGSHLRQGLIADGVRCDSGLFLRSGFCSSGAVRLFNAHIGNNLDCSAGQFLPDQGHALAANDIYVQGSVNLSGEFRATGAVELCHAQIGSDLLCSGGKFEPKEGAALVADDIYVQGSVNLSGEFRATGAVELCHAQIGSDLLCSGGKFEPEEGAALVADGIDVKGVVNLNVGFKATGVVRLLCAQIRGNLVCSGGKFEPKEGAAIIADGIAVKGFVNLNKGFKANGEVRLVGAQIGSSLVCSDGQFESKSEYALSADRAVIQGDVVLKSKFEATGTVALHSAHIGGNLSCAGGHFASKGEYALYAGSTVVKGNIFFKSRFEAIGNVSLIGALVGGDLSCIDKVNISGELDLEGAAIQGKLLLRNLPLPVCIDASAAQISKLADDTSAWAEGSNFSGLVYKSLAGNASPNAAARILWLKKQSAKHLGEDALKQGFRPQPWKQLQKVLREMGHDADAREVGVAYENQLRKADRIGQITNLKNGNRCIPALRRAFLRGLHWLFGFLAGYGYHPLRLFMSLVGVWLFCGVTYWGLALSPNNAIGPTDPLVFQNDAYATCAQKENGTWMLCEQLPAEYTAFSPLAYSLDILLPLVDLGQEKRWGPLVPAPTREFFGELLSLSPPHWVRLLNWFQILYGWIASLLFVAIISGMSRRSEMDK